VTRTRRATGETLLVPSRNRWKKVGRITGAPGKAVEDERVAEGSIVARKAGNAAGAKGPYCSYSSSSMGGRGALIKAPSNLQDLRRRIYAKAKADSAGQGGVGGDSWSPGRKRSQSIGPITLEVKRAGKPGAGNRPAGFDVAGAGDGLTANLTGHEAGNGGHSQGEPTGYRASPRPYP